MPVKLSFLTGIVMWFFRLVFTVCAFFIGMRLGKMKSMKEKKPCPIVYPQKLEVIQIDTGVDVSKLPKCTGPKIYDHCSSRPDTDQTFLHLEKGFIPEVLFGNLHHPSSPAKWAFVITQQVDWPKDNSMKDLCQNIYMTRTGSRSSQPNKCVAVAKIPEGVASLNQHSHRTGYTALLTDQYLNDFSRPHSIEEENDLLPPLLKELPELQADFKRKMGEPINSDGSRKAAIVMVANEGVMDLLLNFICSAEGAQIDLSSIVVFVGTELYVTVIENMGAKAIYSEALGSMPTHAALGYLDNTFSRMMWFKTTSVYLALSSGFDVLFQDVDLVWMKDPLPYLQAMKEDVAFMDDGARTPRYTPFFVNSGFYFLKHNPKTLFFQERMMKAGPSEIGYTHSHQSVLIRQLAEAVHLWGLQVLVLDSLQFPSGEAYHEKKKYLATVINRTFRPFVFHMCWTDNKVNKIVYFKEVGLWFLPETQSCNAGHMMITQRSSIRDSCCQRQKYWPPPGPDEEE